MDTEYWITQLERLNQIMNDTYSRRDSEYKLGTARDAIVAQITACANRGDSAVTAINSELE
jgi:hypothetical protein